MRGNTHRIGICPERSTVGIGLSGVILPGWPRWGCGVTKGASEWASQSSGCRCDQVAAPGPPIECPGGIFALIAGVDDWLVAQPLVLDTSLVGWLLDGYARA
jgi:hypothetical protein